VAEQTFNAAMAAAQAEMSPPSVTGFRGAIRSIHVRRICPAILLGSAPAIGSNFCKPTCEAIGQVQITELIRCDPV